MTAAQREQLRVAAIAARREGEALAEQVAALEAADRGRAVGHARRGVS